MVSSIKTRFITLVCLLLLSFSNAAETKLSASVDRSQIYESDTINLIITGDIEMEFSFGGLMNFGRNQIESPVIEGLEDDFEILDQQQKYNMQSINGETKAQVTWNYSLAPKRTGTLSIPAAKYKNASSEAIQIVVSSGKAPQDAASPPQVFIEALVDKSEAYVQEQVVYTLRLYSADRLASGDLSEPETNDAIIEALGDTKKYYRMAYNRRYEVRERQYLIFPQTSGELTIDAQSFNGLLIDTKNRRRLRVREISEPLTITVKPPPDSFTGKSWLPAASLHLSENWEDAEPDTLKVGDSITRTLEIQALGLLGSALPPIGMEETPGLKLYPDSPSVESVQHESGAHATRRETIALVAISSSEVELPEIRIPWWDTVNDVERVAVIPAHKLSIKPDPNAARQKASGAAPVQTSKQTLMPNNSEAAENSGIGAGQNAPDASNNAAGAGIVAQSDSSNNHFWYTIIALLVIGWISTTYLLLKRQFSRTERPGLEKETAASDHYKRLCHAINKDLPDMPKLLIEWTQQMALSSHSNLKIRSLYDLKQFNETLYTQGRAYEENLYANKESGSHLHYDKILLLQTVKALAKSKEATPKPAPLRPMYP